MKQNIQTMLVGFSLVMLGCSHTLAPNVAVKPTSQYQLCQEREGLKVAVDPFFEEERIKTFFGTDLISHGVLPVLVVIENNHPNSGFLFDKRNFSIVMKGEDSDSQRGTDDIIHKYQKLLDFEKYPGLFIGMGAIAIVNPIMLPPIVTPIMLTPVVVLGFYDTKKESDNAKINQNLMRKAFLDKTIFPGGSHSGFLYFQLKDQEVAKKVVAILIKVKNTISNEEQSFVFQIGR